MPSQEEIDDQLARLAIYRRNLALYLKQRALQGEAFTPPGVANGIVESRSQIRLIKKVLQDWHVSVEDHPDDESLSDRQLESSREVTTTEPTFTQSEDETRERIEFLRKLLQTHTRRLRILEQQAALHGYSTPPEVSIEIEDTRDTISRLNEELQTLQSSIATPLKDKQPTSPATQTSQPLRRLQAFLCHSSGDKPIVRELYKQLMSDGFQPWLDEEDILPGQDWELEIAKAVRTSDVFIVCLSQKSFNRAGYINKEIKYALDVASIQPEGIIFIIPLKVQECEVPETLRKWQWLNYYEDSERGYRQLMRALHVRAKELGLNVNSA